jgi:phosphatidylinositol 4-phosphatase
MFHTIADFIVLVTGRESHGHILGHQVFRATDFKVLPLASSLVEQHPVESHLLALVRAHLFGGTFWFSYTWDLTCRLQEQRLTRDKNVGKAIWETVRTSRFV